jgi:hypothetical protein
MPPERLPQPRDHIGKTSIIAHRLEQRILRKPTQVMISEPDRALQPLARRRCRHTCDARAFERRSSRSERTRRLIFSKCPLAGCRF